MPRVSIGPPLKIGDFSLALDFSRSLVSQYLVTKVIARCEISINHVGFAPVHDHVWVWFPIDLQALNLNKGSGRLAFKVFRALFLSRGSCNHQIIFYFLALPPQLQFPILMVLQLFHFGYALLILIQVFLQLQNCFPSIFHFQHWLS